MILSLLMVHRFYFQFLDFLLSFRFSRWVHWPLVTFINNLKIFLANYYIKYTHFLFVVRMLIPLEWKYTYEWITEENEQYSFNEKRMFWWWEMNILNLRNPFTLISTLFYLIIRKHDKNILNFPLICYTL